MTRDKIIITTCVAICAGAVSAVVYDKMNGSGKNDINDKKTTQDGEISVNDSKSCRCPFSSISGIALTGGVLSGALTWVYYPN